MRSGALAMAGGMLRSSVRARASSSGSGSSSRAVVVERMVERAERAAGRWELATTPFLDLASWQACERHFRNRSDVACASLPSHPSAERRVLVMGKPEALEAKRLVGSDAWQEEYVSGIRLRGNGFKFVDPKRRSHRHVLGSVLGTGIDRGVVGDIVVPALLGADKQQQQPLSLSPPGPDLGSDIHLFVQADLVSENGRNRIA